ncbi:hypothetical protein CVT25_001325 [Psilocybe cyanescens]|uniref:Uncharacterized protein n=1 Tax=Psilocybe cyanescens TaxID=93625 RepID=A0A409XEQ3_PSICY|nr:hypothetical protein CVT25_001325 [Psilocybe cyanescens]
MYINGAAALRIVLVYIGLETLKVLIEIFGRNVGIKSTPAGGYNEKFAFSMPLIETYSYFITEAERLSLSHIELVRYSKKFDVECDSMFLPFPLRRWLAIEIPIQGVPRSTKHDVLKSYGHLTKKPNYLKFRNLT